MNGWPNKRMKLNELMKIGEGECPGMGMELDLQTFEFV